MNTEYMSIALPVMDMRDGCGNVMVEYYPKKKNYVKVVS